MHAELYAELGGGLGTADGLHVSAFAPSPHAVAGNAWFEAYQAVEYRNPDTYSVNGYVAMQALAEGARTADSLDAAAIGTALRSHAVDTLLGALSFEEDGDLADPQIWIYRVVNGEFVQVE